MLASMVLLLFATVPANATTIVIGISGDKIVIAADSRVANEDGTHSDTACKIAALSDRFLFVVSGRARDVTAGKVGWDAKEQAKTALFEVLGRPWDPKQQPDVNFADDVANRWLDLIRQNIADNIRSVELARLKPNQLVVDGMFLGLSPAGNIRVAYAAVRRSKGSPPRIEARPGRPYLVPDAMAYMQLVPDKLELFDEFYKVTSPRANAELAISREQAHKWQPGEFEVRRAMRLVELIIKYDTAHDVGGPIDAVELRKGGTVHWIQQKAKCKE